MSESYKRLLPFVDFIPAKLHTGKSWYISYYYKHPSSNEFIRKRMKLNFIDHIPTRKKYSQKLIFNLNEKLAKGWNPLIEEHPRFALMKLSDALDAFLKAKRGLRMDSSRSYNSYIKTFKAFLEKYYSTDMDVISFDKMHALHYMNYVFNERKVGSNTYNNYVRFMKTLFNWMIDENYCKESPFKDIKKKIRTDKQRIMDIDIVTRKKIADYLIKNHYEFYVIVLIAFNCLLRPKEITFVKVKDIDLEKQTIFIDGFNAKNHNDRISTIPNSMINYIKKLNLDDLNKEHYLFSDTFAPGPNRMDPRKISRRWSNLRKEVGIPMELQFYSLRDSGIIQLLKDGISPKEVMELADHHSLEVTNKYVKRARSEASEVIKQRSSGF
jgi:integrase